jgi:hypothetical protein
MSYNPIISPGCYNIKRLANSSVCVSSPGPQYQAPSTVSLAPLTATAAAPIPSNARELSNRECGMWYQVGSGDYCNMLVLKFGISLVDFIFLNPTINSNCTNLLLGMFPAYFLIILHNSDQIFRYRLLCQTSGRHQHLQRSSWIHVNNIGLFLDTHRNDPRWHNFLGDDKADRSAIC